MKRTILALTLVAVFLSVGTTISNAAETNVQTVPIAGSMGGYLDSNDGTVHIQIPPGAVDGNFNLRYTPNTAGAFSVQPTNAIVLANAFSMDFVSGGDSLSGLGSPGTMVVKYNPPDLGGRSEVALTIMRLSDDGSTWVAIPSTVDLTAHTVTAQFTRSGSYAIVASNAMPTPAPAPAPTAVPAPAPPPAPTAVPAPAPAPAPAAPPSFKLGFATLAALIPDIVGQPLENEHYGANGDSLQQTTRGLMVWRKADNWTAFTDGTTTWINGPLGLQSRLNSDRFPWEKS